MQKALFIKIALVLLLAMLINIPLGMMNNLVGERQARQSQVATEIANSYAEPQFTTGPLLVLPYTEEYAVRQDSKGNDGEAQTRTRMQRRSGALYLTPHSLQVKGVLAADIKKRSLFEVPVYTLDSNWEGTFEMPSRLDVPRRAESSQITWGRPYLSLAVNDPRGFASAPQVEMDGRNLAVEQGSGLAIASAGVKSLLDSSSVQRAGSHHFKLALKLRGTTQLKVIPLADSLKMELSSNWAHPGFDGRFLPVPENQHIGADGFRANWEVSSLATNAQARLTQAMANPSDCANAACLDSFDVRLVNPGNIYQQSDRALKYGFLFIVITFVAFFLFEMLKRLAIHPAQYTLVGLAQAMFFLLLLSLSEHITFTLAYLIAALACVVLVGYYLGHVMRGAWRGAGFAALLGACYAALYGLLVSEDNALLMGSLLLFILLAVAMIVTRKFDWYSINAGSNAAATNFGSNNV